MYIRRDRKKLKDDTEAVYVSLAHNVFESPEDSDKKPRSKPVIYARLGREDELDGEVLDGMCAALERYRSRRRQELGVADDAVRQEVAEAVPTLRLLASRQFGLRMLVEPIWKSLGLDLALQQIADGRAIRFDLERIVFAMVLHRLTDPGSKSACNDWVHGEAWFPEGQAWAVQHFYRALDVLNEHTDQILEAIGRRVRSRLPDDSLALGLIDTTTSYFETDFDDEERAAVETAWRAFEDGTGPEPSTPRPRGLNDPPMRKRGHSKDHRPRAPQVKIGLCTAADGQLIHVEVVPGNTSDQSMTVLLAERARAVLGTMRLAMVMDSGMGGGPNLAKLDELEIDRVSAVPLRNCRFADDRLLSIAGRWARHPYKDGYTYRALLVPAADSPSGTDEWWIATRNKAEARRQKLTIDAELKRIREALAENNSIASSGKPNHPALKRAKRRRYLRVSKDGKRMVFDRDRIRVEQRRAGVHLLRSTLTDLPAELSLRAYDAQYGIEGQFRTYKGPLKLRPMYHQASRRIEAHVLVCSIALVVLRELERRTQRSFESLRHIFAPVRVVQLEQGKTTFWQREEWSDEAAAVLKLVGADDSPLTWGASRT